MTLSLSYDGIDGLQLWCAIDLARSVSLLVGVLVVVPPLDVRLARWSMSYAGGYAAAAGFLTWFCTIKGGAQCDCGDSM